MTRGTIESIWHNRRADGSEYWVLMIDGKRYSTFDPEHVSYIQEGDSVEFSFLQSGSYRNLIALKPLGTAVPAIPANFIRRARAHCILAASLLLANSSQPPEQKAGIAVEMAKKLEGYVLLPLKDYVPDALKMDESQMEGSGE